MDIARFTATDALTGAVLRGARVAVYLAGTQTPAALYADPAGLVGKSNPFTASGTGEVVFSAADGLYDLAVTSGGFAQPLLTNLRLVDIPGAVAGAAAAATTNPGGGFTPWTFAVRQGVQMPMALDFATADERTNLLSTNPTDVSDFVDRVNALSKAGSFPVDWCIRGRANSQPALYPCTRSPIFGNPKNFGPAFFRYIGPETHRFGAVTALANGLIPEFWGIFFDANKLAMHPCVPYTESIFDQCWFLNGTHHGFVPNPAGATYDNYYKNAVGSAIPNLGAVVDGGTLRNCRFYGNGAAWRSDNAAPWDPRIILTFTKGSKIVTISANSPVAPDLTTMVKGGDCLVRPTGADMRSSARIDPPYYGVVSGLVQGSTAGTITLANPWGIFPGAPAALDSALDGVAVGHASVSADAYNGPNWKALVGNITCSGTKGAYQLAFSVPMPFAVRRFMQGGSILRSWARALALAGTTPGLDDGAVWNADFTQVTLAFPLPVDIPAGSNWAMYLGDAMHPPRTSDSSIWQVINGIARGNGGGTFNGHPIYGWNFDGQGNWDSNGYGFAFNTAGGYGFRYKLNDRYTEDVVSGFTDIFGTCSVYRGDFTTSDNTLPTTLLNYATATVCGPRAGVWTTTLNTIARVNADNYNPNSNPNQDVWLSTNTQTIHFGIQALGDASGTGMLNTSPYAQTKQGGLTLGALVVAGATTLSGPATVGGLLTAQAGLAVTAGGATVAGGLTVTGGQARVRLPTGSAAGAIALAVGNSETNANVGYLTNAGGLMASNGTFTSTVTVADILTAAGYLVVYAPAGAANTTPALYVRPAGGGANVATIDGNGLATVGSLVSNGLLRYALRTVATLPATATPGDHFQVSNLRMMTVAPATGLWTQEGAGAGTGGDVHCRAANSFSVVGQPGNTIAA